MASSPATASGIEIYGVNPEDERRVTDLSQQLVEGTYFESGKRNSAVIGKKLAEKLNAKVGSKIVLTSQDASGDLAAGAFRIAGIFKTSSTIFDEGIVFILRPDAGRTFGLDENIHEIALVLDDSKKVAEFSRELGKELEGLDVESWRELAPDLALATESASQQLYIFLIIILLAMVFGITNTMLMGVIERTRELGVLMALGMKGSRIFTMIFLETLALTAVGALIGILLGSGTIHIFGRVGLDMSLFSEGLAAFGMGSVWYPTLPLKEYPIIVLLSAATAIISSLYPGIKAVRLKPVEAIRSY